MKHKLLGLLFLPIGFSTLSHAADVKVTPMEPGEAAYFLQSIQRIKFSADAAELPVIAFYDENDGLVKQQTVTAPTKITFESGEQAIGNIQTEGTIFFFPNPSTDVLFINGLKGTVNAEIYDLNGMRILSQQTAGTMDVSQIPAGSYVLRIDNQVFKVLIK